MISCTPYHYRNSFIARQNFKEIQKKIIRIWSQCRQQRWTVRSSLQAVWVTAVAGVTALSDQHSILRNSKAWLHWNLASSSYCPHSWLLTESSPQLHSCLQWTHTVIVHVLPLVCMKEAQWKLACVLRIARHPSKRVHYSGSDLRC
jgi:hypothetical protein